MATPSDLCNSRNRPEYLGTVPPIWWHWEIKDFERLSIDDVERLIPLMYRNLDVLGDVFEHKSILKRTRNKNKAAEVIKNNQVLAN
jgi:hypothetical protein